MFFDESISSFCVFTPYIGYDGTYVDCNYDKMIIYMRRVRRKEMYYKATYMPCIHEGVQLILRRSCIDDCK